MAKKRDEEKAKRQLGLSPSTARNLLKRNIIYYLAQKTGMDTCFRCGGKIERPQDISIEHKIPWLDADIALFWDMDNIAFSHRICNKPNRNNGGVGRRRLGIDGKIWCPKCQEYLSADDFRSNKSDSNGLQTYCKDCTREYVKEWRSKQRTAL